MSTIHDERYIVLIGRLRRLREVGRLRQADLAERLGKQQSYVSKVEGLERRLDVIELYVRLAGRARPGAVRVFPFDRVIRQLWRHERLNPVALLSSVMGRGKRRRTAVAEGNYFGVTALTRRAAP